MVSIVVCVNFILSSKVNKVDFESSKSLLKNLMAFFEKGRLQVIENEFNRSSLWYQSHSFLAGDSVVVFSVSPSVSTRNFGAQLLCPILTVVGATLVVK